VSGEEHENRELERAAAAYRRMPRVEPPAALDAAVLAAARRAVGRPARPRWPFAIASAAVVVLAVGLGWRAGREQMREPTASPPPIVVPVAAPKPEPAEEGMLDDTLRKQAEAPTTDAAASTTRELPEDRAGEDAGEADRAYADDARAKSVPVVPAPAASRPASAAQPPAESRGLAGALRNEARKESADLERLSAPAAFPEQQAAEATAPVVESGAAPVATEPVPMPAPAPPAPKADAVGGTAAPRAEPAEGPGLGRRDEVRQRRAAGSTLDEPEASQAFDEVRELLRDGHTRRARERLGALLKAHPDLVVPADLQHLLR
jgi:Meckel syndrome type 1 protein